MTILFYKNELNGDIHEIEEGSPSHDNVESLSNWSKVDAPESEGDEPTGEKVQAGPANGSFGEAVGREKTANSVVATALEKDDDDRLDQVAFISDEVNEPETSAPKPVKKTATKKA